MYPLIKMSSSSQTRSCTTVSAVPSIEASKLSSPSRLASETSIVPPVARAMRLRSSFLHLLTAMAPASTKYLRQRSSIPPVVRTTLAPEDRILLILSLVISASLNESSIHYSITRFCIMKSTFTDL